MRDIVCPEPAYQRVLAAGLDKRIMASREKIHDLFLYNGWCDAMEEQRKRTMTATKNFGCARRHIDALDYFDAFEKADKEHNGLLFEDKLSELMLKHPSAFAQMVIGKDVEKYLKYGFPTRRSLEQAMVSYVSENYRDIMFHKEQYCWRRNGRHTTLNHDLHGDFFLWQTEVAGEERKAMTLFGEETEFDSAMKSESTGISGYYSEWPRFLLTLLCYAQATGNAGIPEITEWQKTEQEVGARGTATTECMFGEASHWGLEIMMDRELLRYGERPRGSTISLDSHSEKMHNVPYLSGRKLMIARSSEEGKELYPDCRCKYVDVLEFDEDDLPHLLRGTYRFFGRDRTQMKLIMRYFQLEPLRKLGERIIAIADRNLNAPNN